MVQKRKMKKSGAQDWTSNLSRLGAADYARTGAGPPDVIFKISAKLRQ
jgi:hypothetical protein